MVLRCSLQGPIFYYIIPYVSTSTSELVREGQNLGEDYHLARLAVNSLTGFTSAARFDNEPVKVSVVCN